MVRKKADTNQETSQNDATGSKTRSRATSPARIAELYSASKLGSTGKAMTFESFKKESSNRAGHEATMAYSLWLLGCKEEWTGKRGVLLYGPKTGCGKTHLACAVANRLILQGLLTVYMPTVMIPRNDQNAILELVDPQETPVLILDDLGAEKPTPRLLECLYTIVERRLWMGAPTIVTTNMHPQHIRKYGTDGGYGDKLYSRLMQMCECVPVDGPDRRL